MPRETFRLLEYTGATFAVSIRLVGITSREEGGEGGGEEARETHRFRCDSDIRFLRASHEFSASCIFDVALEYCRGYATLR